MYTINISGSSSKSSIIVESNSAQISNTDDNKSNDYSHLPPFIQALLDKNNFDKFLSNPFLKFSTQPINYFYVGAAYKIFGLFSMFTGQFATHMGAECPSILNQELAALRVYGKIPKPYTIGDPVLGGGAADAPGFLTYAGDTIIITETNTKNNYFEPDVQLLLDLVNKPLAVERTLGYPTSQGFIQHSKMELNDTGLDLTIGLDNVCFSQYFPASVFLSVNTLQQSVQKLIDASNILTYTTDVYNKNVNLAKSIYKNVDELIGIKLKMTDASNNTLFDNVGLFGVESYILVSVHGITALIATRLQQSLLGTLPADEVAPQLVDFNIYNDTTKFFTSKNPNGFNVFGLGMVDNPDGTLPYYWIPEMENLKNIIIENYFNRWARPVIFAYLKMTRELLVEKFGFDMDTLFALQNAPQSALSTGGSGFVLNIPKDTVLYKRYTSNNIYKNYPGL